MFKVCDTTTLGADDMVKNVRVYIDTTVDVVDGRVRTSGTGYGTVPQR